MITQEYLKEIISYCPETGIFTWIKQRCRVNIGQIAGYKHHKGYIYIELKNKQYGAHRLAWLYMTGEWPVDQVDHINLIKDDNRWENLRAATNSQNQYNTNKQCNNTSGYKGVYWDKSKKIWTAKIRVDNVLISLGCFLNKEEAAKSYKEGANRYFGIYARSEA